MKKIIILWNMLIWWQRRFSVKTVWIKFNDHRIISGARNNSVHTQIILFARVKICVVDKSCNVFGRHRCVLGTVYVSIWQRWRLKIDISPIYYSLQSTKPLWSSKRERIPPSRRVPWPRTPTYKKYNNRQKVKWVPIDDVVSSKCSEEAEVQFLTTAT